MVWVEQWMKQEGLELQRSCSRTLSRGTRVSRADHTTAPAAGPDKLPLVHKAFADQARRIHESGACPGTRKVLLK